MDALITLGRYLGQGGLICDTFRKRLESMIDTYIELKFEPHIIISGGDLNGTGYTESRQGINYCKKSSRLPKKILKEGVTYTPEEKSRCTVSNAIETRIICDEKNFKVIGINSSDYHMGRSDYIFTQVFGQDYELTFLPAPSFGDNELKKHMESEKEKLAKAQHFFRNHIPGDLEDAIERLALENGQVCHDRT